MSAQKGRNFVSVKLQTDCISFYSLSNWNIDFFRVFNLSNRITCILAHNEFKLFCIPSELSLEEKKWPGSAEVQVRI